jgi:ATP-dependent DNA helicase RecQ
LAKRLFRVETIRPGQLDGVAALLSGQDLLLSLPTGGGKSLVFHLAALLAPGAAVIVAPLRSLLRDQARRLAEYGIGHVGLFTGDDPVATRQALSELAKGQLRMALIAPERLDLPLFREALRGSAETAGISFVVIDEAHCVARRGHDWRPAYRAFGPRIREWASSEGRVPALAALSGNVSVGALNESERLLDLHDPVRVKAGTARTNLSFHVEVSRDPFHFARLRELLKKDMAGPGIIFCPHVDGHLGSATLAHDLVLKEGIDAASYSGRPPAGIGHEDWAAQKKKAADDFLIGRHSLLCATKAFGLGVDRADVRFAAHLGLPASLEEYYQQAGRAGRDGQKASCWILMQCLSARRARRWEYLPLEKLRGEIFSLREAERDDVSRAYGFHLAKFPGEEVERKDVELTLMALPWSEAEKSVQVDFPGQDEEAFTRALVHLERIGAVRLEGRRGDRWRIRVVGKCAAQTVLSAAYEAIHRDYEAIEPARRASLAELISLVLEPEAGAAIYKRLTGLSDQRPIADNMSSTLVDFSRIFPTWAPAASSIVSSFFH